MRSLLLPLFLFLLIGCTQQPTNQMRFSGTIENSGESGSVKLYRGTTLLQEIPLDSDGSFDGSFPVEEGLAFVVHGSNFKRIYVKNGFNAKFTADNADFTRTAKLTGDGADIFNLEEELDQLEADYSDLIIDHPTLAFFDSTTASYRSEFLAILNENDLTDSAQVHHFVTEVDDFISRFRVRVQSRVNVTNELVAGDPSPSFVNYENLAGGFSSLSDFRGKYVYIDFWTTWCGPCLKEFPRLKELESEYAGRNIEFLYLSIESPQEHGNDAGKARDAWITFVEEHNMGGVHVRADRGFDSDFLKDYKIEFIPRYVLIDPEGKIVSADAPRPSNPQLVALFEELGI